MQDRVVERFTINGVEYAVPADDGIIDITALPDQLLLDYDDLGDR